MANLISQIENKFSKWKINFQMENLFPKWKINLPNGKFISQMENQFRKREILFPKWKINFPNFANQEPYIALKNKKNWYGRSSLSRISALPQSSSPTLKL